VSKPITRLVQITLSREAHVLLAKLILKRTEDDYPPSRTTKSALIDEAIRRLAEEEGIVMTGDTPQGAHPAVA
jgi:hypothetical protein